MTEIGVVVFVSTSLFDEIKGGDHISILQNFWKYHLSMKPVEFRDLYTTKNDCIKFNFDYLLN